MLGDELVHFKVGVGEIVFVEGKSRRPTGVGEWLWRRIYDTLQTTDNSVLGGGIVNAKL